ncbi:DUF554 domain-containing protein [Anaerotruncus colihominis]|uniref:DUF554 domain-containing protein n=1 Tax=Anaerotruncus colihominis TaxID=169435 RepID=UPI0018A99D0B|nr:DUF554 domain-containing protein [Anaerotruncus colihominis]
MTFTGVFINSIGVFTAGILGALLKRSIPDRIKNALLLGLGLCVLYIGITGFSAETNVIVLVFSISFGVLLGEFINIDGKLNRFGAYVQKKFPFRDDHIADGFVSSTLFVCVGAMSIVGGIESGTKGTYDTFLAKAFIDTLVVFILATSKGISCCLSAIVALIYQAMITLSAGWISGLVNEAVISQMSEIGSLLIVGIALNLLNISHLKIGNFILAPFVPAVLFAGETVFMQIL